MEFELQTDLSEALDGLDPLELLIDDPQLAAAAKDIEENDEGFILSNSFIKNTSVKSQLHKKRGQRRDEGRTLVCAVCGAAAKGFRYYGAVSCTSCRAFFKRSIQRDTYKTFLCQQGDFTCHINSKSRKSCQLCRFNLCLQRGMSIPGEKINADNYGGSDENSQSDKSVLPLHSTRGSCQGRQRMHDYLTESKKERFQNNLAQKLHNLLNTESLFTLTDIVTLEQISQMQLYMEKKFMFAIVQGDLDFLHKLNKFIYLRENNPVYLNKGLEDFMMLCGTEAFMKYSSQMGDYITKKDLMRLARGNMPLMIEHIVASRIGTCFDPKPRETEHYNTLLDNDCDKQITRLIHQIHVQVYRYIPYFLTLIPIIIYSLMLFHWHFRCPKVEQPSHCLFPMITSTMTAC